MSRNKDIEDRLEQPCTCGKTEPCGCSTMLESPHCLWCCHRLPPEAEAAWRASEDFKNQL